MPMTLQLASHIAWTFASTWHSPPETDRSQVTMADWPAMRMALILLEACVHASLSSLSGAEPSVGFMAVHVSVTPRSVSIAMQALSTSVSIVLAIATRSAADVTSAFVFASIDRL